MSITLKNHKMMRYMCMCGYIYIPIFFLQIHNHIFICSERGDFACGSADQSTLYFMHETHCNASSSIPGQDIFRVVVELKEILSKNLVPLTNSASFPIFHIYFAQKLRQLF